MGLRDYITKRILSTQVVIAEIDRRMKEAVAPTSDIVVPTTLLDKTKR